MDKKILNRVRDFIAEAESLPNSLSTEQEFDSYRSAFSDEERGEITDLQNSRFHAVEKLRRKLLAFFSVHLDDDSNYYSLLGSITFRPKEGIYNHFHYRDNEAWIQDKTKLLNLLELLENEFIEKSNIEKPKASKVFQDKDMFSSALFWTIITIVGSVAFFLGLYKAEFDKTSIENELKYQKSINTEQAKEIVLLKTK